MKKIFLSISIIGLLCTGLFAQKIAYVNSDEVLLSMSEVAQMKTALEAKTKELSTQLQPRYKEYEEKYKYMVDNKETMMPAVFESKMQELKTLEDLIVQLEKKAQQDVAAYEKELYTSIEKKAMKIINEVADEKGYTHVFDIAAGGVLKFPDADNITAQVKAKL